jgi:hypothetical protein
MTEQSTAKELAAALQTLLAAQKVPTEAERVQAGYEEAKRFVPDLTIEQYEAEVDAWRTQHCDYFMRLPEALEKGVIVDESIFDNFEEASALMAKSKYVLMHSKPWSAIIGSNQYACVFDPITRHDLALNGQLGTALGCAFYTDAFMAPHLKDKSPETVGKVIFVPRDTE